jgi:hypothetical protein
MTIIQRVTVNKTMFALNPSTIHFASQAAAAAAARRVARALFPIRGALWF